MSWLNAVLPFAAGFVKGFVSEYTRAEPAGRLSSPHYYDFQQHMAALAEATGIHLTNLHERRASFLLPFRGGQYIASAVLAGDRIALAVFSRIEFPLGGIPGDLVRAVKRLNAQLPHCDFEILDLDDTCVWCAQGMTTAMSLTPQVFEAALSEMVICVYRLDCWLVEHGFAR